MMADLIERVTNFAAAIHVDGMRVLRTALIYRVGKQYEVRFLEAGEHVKVETYDKRATAKGEADAFVLSAPLRA